MPSKIARRSFLRSAAAMTAATTLPAWFLAECGVSTVAQERRSGDSSPNDKPGIALIGCGGRGRAVASQAATHGNLVAFCDVDGSRFGEAKKQWPQADAFSDFRKVLERKDVDVIVNGTPDHWHTLVNLAALKAGKDV